MQTSRLAAVAPVVAALAACAPADLRTLLLDEITSALDPEPVGEVLGLGRDLRDQGTTMVIATHEMSFARDVADRVCLLDRGRVLEQGPPAELFDSPQDPRTRQFVQRVILAP